MSLPVISSTQFVPRMDVRGISDGAVVKGLIADMNRILDSAVGGSRWRNNWYPYVMYPHGYIHQFKYDPKSSSSLQSQVLKFVEDHVLNNTPGNMGCDPSSAPVSYCFFPKGDDVTIVCYHVIDLKQMTTMGVGALRAVSGHYARDIAGVLSYEMKVSENWADDPDLLGNPLLNVHLQNIEQGKRLM